MQCQIGFVTLTFKFVATCHAIQVIKTMQIMISYKKKTKQHASDSFLTNEKSAESPTPTPTQNSGDPLEATKKL